MLFRLQDLKTNQFGFNQLTSLYDSAKDLAFDELTVDFSHCSWFDANMSAPLGTILTLIGDEFNTIEIVGLTSSVERILRKNRLLVGYGYAQLPDTNETVAPYRRFSLDEDRYFAAYIQKYTLSKGIPRMTAALKRRFDESLGEIFANAVGHSQSRLGIFSCGQYFPRKNIFDFCLTDAGIGFRGSIHKEYGKWIPSTRAMRLCLSGDFTTKRNEPGGLGLKLLRQFIKLNKGRIVIVSNRAYFEFSSGSEETYLLDAPFPGTCVNLEINTADTANYRLSSEF